MKLAWITDTHLNSLRPPGIEAFFHTLAGMPCDGLLLSGDIGEADNVAHLLNALDTTVRRPAYFVLGNHDFYRGSIAGVRADVARRSSE